MSRARITTFIADYRWPLGLVGLLVMSIVAQGIMVFFATRPDAPRPLRDYYQAGLHWDADEAVRAASRQLGWGVRVDVPSGPEYVEAMARPVDVFVSDRDGQPVRGLKGQLVALRPSDTGLNTSGALTELPQEPGRYRALVTFRAAGLWELALDVQAGGQRFVHVVRVDLARAEAPP